MNRVIVHRLIAALVVLILVCGTVEAGVGRAVARGAARGAARSVQKAAARSAARNSARRAQRAATWDRLRDARTQVSTLAKPRTVHRYVDNRTLSRELKHGFSKGAHFTSRAKAGRPLGPLGSRLRLGLTRTPRWRETVRLDKGNRVSFNKVLGGNRAGAGEISAARKMSFGQVRRVVPTARPQTALGRRIQDRLHKRGLQ